MTTNSSASDVYWVTFPSGRKGFYRNTDGLDSTEAWKKQSEALEAIALSSVYRPYRLQFPEIVPHRFWLCDEVIHSMYFSRHKDVEEILPYLQKLYPCVQEKDLLDTEWTSGYRDIYIHNTTMLKLFSK